MPMTSWDDLARQISELCVRIPAAAGPGALARELARELSPNAPQLAFREVLARGGWYRLGGVVDVSGRHVADDLAKWAETELASHGDDLVALYDDYADSGLKATRLTGRTHYLVAVTGTAAADFIQIEIEELQEMACHVLFGGDTPPGSVEDLVDPRGGDGQSAIGAVPLGIPFLALRRLTPVADFLARMRTQKPEPQPIHRFIEAWESSSAGAATQFSNHWVLGVREHLDRFRQTIVQASPIAAVNGAPPRFDGAFGVQGLSLRNALSRYDKAAGYPMAWFFNMITTRSVPHALAATVIDDMQSGFNYLPDRDVAVVKEWLYRPYAF
jgi:hypothetical protein